MIGRKNHYGSRSQRGTEVAAIYYSVLESALLNDLDPRAFLEYAAKKSILAGEAAMPWRQAG